MRAIQILRVNAWVILVTFVLELATGGMPDEFYGVFGLTVIICSIWGLIQDTNE